MLLIYPNKNQKDKVLLGWASQRWRLGNYEAEGAVQVPVELKHGCEDVLLVIMSKAEVKD